MHAQRCRAPQGKPTNHGCFRADDYYELGANQLSMGVHMRLLFEPDSSVRATKVGLTQAVRSVEGGESKRTSPLEQQTSIASGATQGWHIDQGGANPLYAAESAGASETHALGETPTVENRGQHGEPAKGIPAILIDSPMLPKGAPPASQTFETTALALDGPDRGKYLGSVRWGWTSDDGTTSKKIDFQVISNGVPSETFMAAAEQWNRAKVGADAVVARDNAPFWTDLEKEPEHLKSGEAVVVISKTTRNAKPLNEVWAQTTKKFGHVHADDLRIDERKAQKSINLPTYAEVRAGRSSSTPLVATLGERARFTVVGSVSFGTMGALAAGVDTYDVEVEFDALQPGVTLATPSVFGGKLRGFMQRSKYEALQP